MQGSEAPADVADSLAAATEDAAAPAPDVSAPALPEAAPADAAQRVAAVKPEPDGELQQPGDIVAGDSAEAVTELAPAAVRTAAGSPQSEAQPEVQQQNGAVGSANGSAEQLQVGSKRPLEGGAASEGPPVKIKREAA